LRIVIRDAISEVGTESVGGKIEPAQPSIP
jgi:hypothetical protein